MTSAYTCARVDRCSGAVCVRTVPTTVPRHPCRGPPLPGHLSVPVHPVSTTLGVSAGRRPGFGSRIVRYGTCFGNLRWRVDILFHVRSQRGTESLRSSVVVCHREWHRSFRGVVEGTGRSGRERCRRIRIGRIGTDPTVLPQSLQIYQIPETYWYFVLNIQYAVRSSNIS